MTIKKDDIKVFKLSSGEEFIAKVSVAGEAWITVENPTYFIKGADGKTELRPFMGTSEKEVMIDFSKVVAIGAPIKGVLDIYTNQSQEDKVELIKG